MMLPYIHKKTKCKIYIHLPYTILISRYSPSLLKKKLQVLHLNLRSPSHQIFSHPNHLAPHLVTFTFPKGTTNSELGALMGATEKARSAVAWCKAKWMCMAPLLHSTVHTKEAERWRPKAGDKLLEVKSLAFKPGVGWLVGFLRRNGGEKRKHVGLVDHHWPRPGWDKEHHEFYICTVFPCWMILMRPTSRKPHETKKWPHIERLFRKKTSYKASVQETIDTDVATIPTSHLQRVSKWPCGCRDLNLNMT